MAKPDTSTLARRSAVAVEDIIRGESLETLVLIAPDGREVARETGQPDQVGFSQVQWKLAKDCTCTHNHPQGTSFSLEDALAAAPHGLREIRVVTKFYRHMITRLDSGLMIPLHASFQAEEQAAYLFAVESARQGLISLADVKPEARHRTWQRLDNRFAIGYWRERT